MIHRTYRRLDEPMRFAGFSLKQWVVLLLGGGALIGAVYVLRVPTKPAITLCAFLIGVPAALAYVSDGGGVSPTQLLRDLWRWRTRPSRLSAGADTTTATVLIAAPHEADPSPAPTPPRRAAAGGRR